MNVKPIYFKKKGLDKFQNEYDELIKSRPEAVSELSKVRAMGDLSENGYYKSAKSKLSEIDRRLRQLKHILKVAKIKQANPNIVDIGSTVALKSNSQTKTYQIVGTYEANPSENKISIYSPLGKILNAKKKGDNVTLEIGTNKTEFKILDIK